MRHSRERSEESRNEYSAADLLNLLEFKKPLLFHPNWILNNVPNLYFHFRRNKKYRSSEGQIDWGKIIATLPPEWQKRWTILQPEGREEVDVVINSLVGALERLRPATFGPSWIEYNNNSTYEYFKRHFRNEDASVNWQILLNFLPPQWREKWSYVKPKEKSKVKSAELPEIIAAASREKGQDISPKEQDVIDKIVATAPEEFNQRGLTIWCNQQVNKVLLEHPDIAERAKIIVAEVRNEVLFRINKKRFEELKQQLKPFLQPSAKLSPRFFDDNFNASSQFLQRHFRKADGSIDWDFIVKKLGIEEYFQMKELWDENSAFEELRELLERENPENFNPKWIEEHNLRLYTYFRTNRSFRNFKGAVDWDGIMNKIPSSWKKRFSLLVWNR